MTKRTLRGTNYKRIKISGFRARMSTPTGRRILKLRRKRGRAKLSASS
nr:ribosomal protein L34 [Sahlingia subintegra]